MTEEQLLAQSADEYMSANQLTFFKERLITKATMIQTRIAGYQYLFKIERQPDDTDTASIEEDRANALCLIEMDNDVLERVRIALRAITERHYGWCAETGEPIGLKRLLIMPESLLSIEAMQVREAKNRHLRMAV